MSKIEQIMKELGLNPNDEAQKRVIEQLVGSRPNVAINREFMNELRRDLQGKAQDKTQHQSTNFLLNLMNTKIVFAALLLVMVLAGGAFYVSQQSGQPLINIAGQNGDTQLLSGKYAVTEVSANSFGALSTANLTAGGRGVGMGGDNAQSLSQVAPATQASQSSSAGSSAESAKMIAPGEPNPNIPPSDTSLPYPGGEVYQFEYKGGTLPNLPSTESVYKRVKPSAGGGIVNRIIQTITLGLIDLNKLQSAELQSFTINENREYGYNVNVAVDQGTVGIYQNWERWPQPAINLCRDERCFAQNRLRPSDLPSDEDAIAIADGFLSEYAISREGYGQPQVMDQWRIAYELAADKANFYVPEMVQVVYPLTIDGQKVYDEGGNPHGLNVVVDARTKRVSSLYELSTKQFQRSDYVGETNSQRIIDVAERGGYRNYPYSYPGAKVVTLELGTPTREMVNVWYGPDGKAGQPLYVPALVFPIQNQNATYWRKNVIVPLVKEMLDSDNQPPVTIMDGRGGDGVDSPRPPIGPASDPDVLPDAAVPKPTSNTNR